MFNKVKEFYLKYKEIINYLIFGGLTTVVSFATYYVSAQIFKIDEVVSNGISWVLAVTFAYITNKIFVFESKSKDKKDILREVVSFFGFRAISGLVIDIGLFALLVKVFKINDLVVKLFTQVLIIVVNYIFSKLIIFKRKEK